MRLLLKRLLSYLPSNLPVGMTEFSVWEQEIYELAGPIAEEDSMRFVLCNILTHGVAPGNARVPKNYFVQCLRLGAAKQIAGAVFQDIKTRQLERVKEAEAAAQAKPVEATTPQQVVSNGEAKEG